MVLPQNHTIEFILVGFSDSPNIRIPLFIFFLCIYIMTLLGNMVLILLICSSTLRNKPMYFFLCNLSFLDIVYTSVTFPKLIHIFATGDGKFSLTECAVQHFFFVAFWNTEYFLLTVMSYDRYVAICRPLHYALLMNRNVCIISVVATWLGGMLGSISSTTTTFMASYRVSNKLNHFICDIKALEEAAISDTTSIRNAIIAHGILCVATAFIFTLVSYILIIFAILKIRSARGKYKAFSTCASHLSVVSCFYVLLFVLYLRPKATVSPEEGKALTVLYVYIIPLLNPVVYSFRNKDVRYAFQKIVMNTVHT